MNSTDTQNPGRAALSPEEARTRMLQAALRCLSSWLAPESVHADAEAGYASDELALAARDLVTATDALRGDQRPAGWPS